MHNPKSKIATENETRILQWLRTNDAVLPLSLYELTHELGMSFGAVRGTLLRLAKQSPSPILLTTIQDGEKKKYKTLVANRFNASAHRINSLVQKSTPHVSPLPIPALKHYLEQLLALDAKVSEISAHITAEMNGMELLELFLKYDFGLTQAEQQEVQALIQDLEAF